MQLIEIDKAVYRKNLNRVIIGFIASLTILALAYGAVLIQLFSPEIIEGETVNNFRFNFLGVVFALLTNVLVLHKLKTTEMFKEIYYVWQLKQIHNLIYRKLKKIKALAKEDNVDAFIILYFYYTSIKQVYLLDDNTLTMNKVDADLAALNDNILERNLTITTEQFDRSLLSNIRYGDS